MFSTTNVYLCPICKGRIVVSEESNDDYEFVSGESEDIPVHFNCLASYQGDDFLGVDNNCIEDFQEE